MESVDSKPDPSPQQYWPCCQRSSSRCIPPLFVKMSRQIAMEMTGLGNFYVVYGAGLRRNSGPKEHVKTGISQRRLAGILLLGTLVCQYGFKKGTLIPQVWDPSVMIRTSASGSFGNLKNPACSTRR